MPSDNYPNNDINKTIIIGNHCGWCFPHQEGEEYDNNIDDTPQDNAPWQWPCIDNNYTQVMQVNLKKARKCWAQILRVLKAENATP